MRTFVALELPEPFALQAEDAARALRRRVSGRFVRPDSLHVTLAFLGDIPEGLVGRACDAVEAVAGAGAEGAAADIAAPQRREVRLRCSGLGMFGKRGDATLWLDLGGSPGLEELAEEMRAELARRDVPFESKPFRAHVTLARHADLSQAKLPEVPFPLECPADTLALLKSTLTPERAVYTPLLEVKL